MKNFDGALGFDAYIADTDFNKTIASMNRRIESLSNKTLSETDRMGLGFRNLSTVVAGAIAGMGLAQLPGQIVKVRGEFQQLEIALNTMLGSKSKADKLMGEIIQTAATTPFGMKDLASGTKQLIAYGSAAETVMGEIRMLGDVASGVTQPIGDLIYLYGTLRTQGRAYAVDIRQFAGRGIPIYAELAKVLKINEDQVISFVEAGKVGFKEVEQAFRNMTGVGGMFNNLMDAQSKSIPGLIERLKDGIDVAFNEIGTANQGTIEEVIKGATVVVENYEKIIDVLKVVVATYGTYRAALMLTAATEKLSGTARLIFFHAQLAKATGVSTVAAYAHATALGVQTKAQAALNTVMAVNPFVAGATAAVALASAIWYLSDSTTAQEKAQEALNESTKEAEARKEELSAKTSKLASVIRDETQTRYAQTKAFSELKKLYPEILAQMQMYEFKALSAADAQKMFNAALDEMGKAGLKSNFDAAVKKVSELEQRLKNLNDSNSGTGGLTVAIEKTRKELEAARIESEKLGQQIKEEERLGWLANATNEEKLKYYNDQVEAKKKERDELEKIAQGADAIKKIFAEMSLLGINKEIGDLLGNVNSLNSQLGGKPLVDGGNKAYWEKIKKDAEESRDSLGIGQKGSAEWKKLSAEIENADKKLQAYSSTVKRSKKADEVFLPTSLKGLEQAAQKARDIMERLPGTDQAGIKKQQEIIIQAEKRIAEIRKSIAVKSFEEEIAEKQKQYELFERWVQYAGKDAAKAQFSGLLANGASYADYLNAEIEKLTNKGLSSGYSDEDLKQLDSLKSLFNDFTGAISPMEKFQKTLDDARESAGSLTEEIIRLKEIQAGLNPADNSSSGYEKRSLVQQRLNEAEKERRYLLGDFLRSVAGSEERRLSIEKKYADLRADLDARTADKKAAGYLKALKRIDDAEKKELEEDKDEAAQKSKEYKAFVKVLEKQQDELKKIDIENARENFKRFTENLDKESDEYKKHYKDLEQLEKDFANQKIANLNAVANAASDIGAVMNNMGGDWAGVGQVITAASDQIRGFAKVMSEIGTDKSEGFSLKNITSIIGLITQAISAVFDIIKKSESALDDFKTNAYNFRTEDALLSNRNIGGNYSDNPFLTDYSGMIKAGVDQYSDAMKQYNDAIAMLDHGNAITGYRTGLLVRKSKKFITDDLLKVYPNLVDEAGNLNRELAQTLISTNQVGETTKALLQTAIAWADQVEAASDQIIDSVMNMTGVIGNDLTDAMVNAFKAGEDGAKAMSDVLGGVIESFVKNTVLVDILRPILDEFNKGVQESYRLGGDGTILDDIMKLNSQLPDAYNIASEVMTGIKQMGKDNGMNIFSSEDDSSQSKSGLQGAIKGMTEETASVLVGQFNAIRIYQADMAGNTGSSGISVGEFTHRF